MVNAEDEIFWSKVRDAYHLVVNTANEVEITVGNKEATIYDQGNGYIAIKITEIESEKPTLVVPT
jgi:hypothetical protein